MNKYIHYILLVIMPLMTIWTLSSCSEESFDENSNGYGKLKFEAILPGSNGMSTRTVYVQDQYGKLKSGWDSNDRLTVYGFTSGTNTFANPDIDKSTEEISRWSNSQAVYQKGENLVAVYPASTISNGVVEMDFSNQDGTLENLKNYDLMVSDKVPYEQAEVKFQMARKNVFLRIEVQKSSFGNSAAGITITINGTRISKASLNLNDGTYSIDGTDNIRFTNTRTDIPESNGYYLFYVAVPCVNGSVPITNISVSKSGYLTTRYKNFNSSPKMTPGYIYSTKLSYILSTSMLDYGEKVNEGIYKAINNDPSIVKKITFKVNSSETSNINVRWDNILNAGRNNGIYVVPKNNGEEIVISTNADIIYTNNDPSKMFRGLYNLVSIENLSLVKMDNAIHVIRDMSEMFSGCNSLKKVDLSSFITRNVSNFYSMFKDCGSLSSLDLSNFDTGNATNMSSMFSGCRGLKNVNVTSFETGRVMNFSSMFNGCSSLSNLDLSNFDTGNATNMSSMFSGCHGLKNINVTSFETGRVMNFSSMFKDCSSLSNLDLSSFDTTYTLIAALGIIVTGNKNLSEMFFNCTNLENLNLGPNYVMRGVYFEWSFTNTNAFVNVASESKKCNIICLQQTKPYIISNGLNETGKTITWINSETGQPLQ